MCNIRKKNRSIFRNLSEVECWSTGAHLMLNPFRAYKTQFLFMRQFILNGFGMIRLSQMPFWKLRNFKRQFAHFTTVLPCAGQIWAVAAHIVNPKAINPQQVPQPSRKNEFTPLRCKTLPRFCCLPHANPVSLPPHTNAANLFIRQICRKRQKPRSCSSTTALRVNTPMHCCCLE